MNLAKFHYELLSYLTHHNYSSGLELQNVFPNQKLRVEESIKYLYEQIIRTADKFVSQRRT